MRTEPPPLDDDPRFNPEWPAHDPEYAAKLAARLWQAEGDILQLKAAIKQLLQSLLAHSHGGVS